MGGRGRKSYPLCLQRAVCIGMIGQECLRTHERNALACTPRVLSPLWWGG